MKKVLVTVLLIAGMSAIVWADIPSTIHYQGRLTNTTGEAIADGTSSITFRLWDALSSGTMVWTGTYDVATKNGYYNVELGSGLFPFTGMTFNMAYYLEMKVGTDPDYTSPRIKMNSVPYAMRAKNTNYAIEAESTTIAATVIDNAITEVKIADDAVTENKINDSAVTNSKLADGAVDSAKIQNGTIVGADISTTPDGNRINTTNIETSAIDSRTIADGAVTIDKIASGATTGQWNKVDGNTYTWTTSGKQLITSQTIDLEKSTIINVFAVCNYAYSSGTSEMLSQFYLDVDGSTEDLVQCQVNTSDVRYTRATLLVSKSLTAGSHTIALYINPISFISGMAATTNRHHILIIAHYN